MLEQPEMPFNYLEEFIYNHLPKAATYNDSKENHILNIHYVVDQVFKKFGKTLVLLPQLAQTLEDKGFLHIGSYKAKEDLPLTLSSNIHYYVDLVALRRLEKTLLPEAEINSRYEIEETKRLEVSLRAFFKT